MNKVRTIIILIFSFCFCTLFAEAPEMEIFAPTEWKLLNKLDANKKIDFIAKNDFIIKDCDEINQSYLEGRSWQEQMLYIQDLEIYEEYVNGDIFYWFLMPIVRSDYKKQIMANAFWFP